MHLTVKLRQRRCQGDERHSNRYHVDDSVASHQPRSRHVGLVFEPAYVQQIVTARNILACVDQKLMAISTAAIPLPGPPAKQIR